MRHHIIWWLNWAFMGLIAICLVGALWIHSARAEVIQNELVTKTHSLPHSSFSPKDKNYEQLGVKPLQLEYQPPKIRIPDLRSLIFYQGHNLRPDAKDADTLFFSIGQISENNPAFSIRRNEKIYLVAQDNPLASYVLSEANRPTALWIEAQMRPNGANVQVRMKDEQGDLIVEPKDRANFTLTEKPPANQSKAFNLDQYRADATLLSRQKAKWYGNDVFLEDHGGMEFDQNAGKQRLQFGEGGDLYSIYLDKGDVMIWKEGKWVVPGRGEVTQKFPLAKVSKMEDRVMAFELFDVSGKSKVNLNLLKAQEPSNVTQNLGRDFQFIGARTKIHSMFKVSNKREVVGPNDWFLQTPEGWKKLKTSKEIDAFVSGLTPGALLVIDKIEKQKEDQWLAATYYNRSRSGSDEVILQLKTHPSDTEKPSVDQNIESEELERAIPRG